LFYATFLDGIRGIAALGVVYTHNQTMYDQRLAFNSFDFLYHEKRKRKKNTDSVVINKIDHSESDVDLEIILSNVPLLSLTDSDNIVMS
ncbi:27993_t:CDS:2, partial [Racocetra persica]